MIIQSLIKAVKFIWQYGKSWIIVSVIFSVILGVLPIVLIWLTKELVNEIAALISEDTGSYQTALGILLLQFGVMVLGSVVRHIQGYLDQRMAIEVEHKLKYNIAEKLNNVPYTYFDIPEFYDHVERIDSNAGSRFLSPVNNIFALLEAVISIVSLLGFLLSIHWSLAVISVMALIPVLLIKSFYGNRQFWLNYYMAPVAREAGYLQRLLTEREHTKEVRLFNLSDYLLGRWSDRFLLNARNSLTLLKKSKRAEIGLDGLSALFYSMSAGILIWLTQRSAVRIGEFVAIGQAVQNTQSSIVQISTSIAGIYEDSLYIKDYFHFMDFDEEGLQSTHGQSNFPNRLTSGITFNEVSFKYPRSENRALKDVSFSIRPGEKIAIVGHNGSGKTSLIKCLLGLYPVSEGSIHFDGLNINDINEKSLRENITVIFQDFIKYSFTAKENIGFSNIGDLDNTHKIQEAAVQASIHGDLMRLQDKYETHLGKHLKEGVDLSGGQWQKVAIARALFKNSGIVILDEPTAALDPLAEVEIFKQFKSLTDGKTAFFVSHRMAVGKMVDRIMVMDKGELIEMGTHEELLKQQGEYAKLYNAQLEWMNYEYQAVGV